ncbi:hypothetical protein V6Z11_A04G037500 [Gossypium hirsutum]
MVSTKKNLILSLMLAIYRLAPIFFLKLGTLVPAIDRPAQKNFDFFLYLVPTIDMPAPKKIKTRILVPAIDGPVPKKIDFFLYLVLAIDRRAPIVFFKLVL